MSQDVAELVKNMLAGDKSSLAHLISLIERGSPKVPEIMELVSPFLHHAYRIGITGLAGSGKSTVIDKLTSIMRSKGITVGIVAVDPSSAITGGAVLGDRIRMQQHYLDEGVFIRSMATRGSCGGLSRAVADTVKLLDASGKDIILIETTGVGQTETDITGVADTVVVLLVPGFGDSIQLMKAGLIEIADIIVVNKSDLDGAEILVSEIKDELSYSPRKADQALIVTQANSDIA
ncbi:MAG: methylmalonyl Co-A mutase-associated GTPase MeaB, partial [Dehalococcoidia bacterium]|nr:methylmalonyl Co-A mutase-associated GTPase MeaB [Dehalococcoidia bacterium]